MSPAGQKKYPRHFRKAWLSDILFKNWLLEVAGKDNKAKCRFCDCFLDAKRHSFIHHLKSKKHKSSAAAFSSIGQQNYFPDASRRSEATAEDTERPYGHSTTSDPGYVTYTESKHPITFEIDESLNENDQDYGAETIQLAEDEVTKNATPLTKQRMTGSSRAESDESARNKKILDAALGFFNIVSRHSAPAATAIEEDDDEVFGRYLVRELKNIENEKLKKQMKQKLLNMVWNTDADKEVVNVPFPIFVSAGASLPLHGKKKDQS